MTGPSWYIISDMIITWKNGSYHGSARQTTRLLSDGIGPIATAVKSERYERIQLLTNYPHRRSHHYCTWLEGLTGHSRIELQEIALASPIDHASIYCDGRR